MFWHSIFHTRLVEVHVAHSAHQLVGLIFVGQRDRKFIESRGDFGVPVRQCSFHNRPSAFPNGRFLPIRPHIRATLSCLPCFLYQSGRRGEDRTGQSIWTAALDRRRYISKCRTFTHSLVICPFSIDIDWSLQFDHRPVTARTPCPWFVCCSATPKTTRYSNAALLCQQQQYR